MLWNIPRPLVRGLIFTLLLSFASLLSAAPNIVVVLFDDLGYGQPPGYNPASTFKLPQFERLMREGMLFRDAHAAAAVCTPTRYGVLTGRYPARRGQFGVLTTFSKPIIPPARLTIASLLKQHGYATACIGKWHLGWDWVEGRPGDESQVPIGAQLQHGPTALGFDYFFGFTHARNIGTLVENDAVVEHVSASENQPRMISAAVDWIESQPADKPFFLYFPMCPPHTPVAPAPEFLGVSGAEDVVGKDPQYGDWILQGDAMLGELLDALDRCGFTENTLVIATSDNGAERRAYAPLRDSKRSIYEGGHRVPFVARWPGVIVPGSKSESTISLNDLMATFADVTGSTLPVNAGEDSVSLLPVFRDGQATVRHTTLHQSMAGDLALRSGRWKLICFTDGRRELYDVVADLGETHDLFAEQPDVAIALTQALQTQIDQGRSTPGPDQTNDVPLSLEPRLEKKRK